MGAVKRLLPEIVGLLAFPTSGAGAIASPSLALNGRYSNAMALSAPSANATYVSQTPPKITTSSNGSSRICHREYVADINFPASESFDIAVATPINPANAELFPWLSAIAVRWETYRFRSLRFIYEPQCGTMRDGTVMMAVDFDVVDPAPLDKQQIMTYQGAVRTAPWFAGVYNCTPANLSKLKEYYINSSATAPSGTDPKTYFVGQIFVAVQSATSDAFQAGELYVEYDVELLTPQSDSVANTLSYMSNSHNNGTDSYSATWELGLPDSGSLDVTWLQGIPNAPVTLNKDASNGIIITNAGSYLVSVFVQGSSVTPVDVLLPYVDVVPTGFEPASIWPHPGAQSSASMGVPPYAALGDDTVYTGASCIVSSLAPPFFVGFQASTILGPPAILQGFTLIVTSLDQSVMSQVLPLSTPVLAAANKTAKLLARARSKAQQRERRSLAKTPNMSELVEAMTTAFRKLPIAAS
jgi:hypothetical protein